MRPNAFSAILASFPVPRPDDRIAIVALVTVQQLFETSTSTFLFPDGSICSCAEVAERGVALARQWRRSGLGPGDRVAIRMPNSLRYLESLAACAIGRFVAVSVNTRFSNDEARTLIERSGAIRVVDATAEFAIHADLRPIEFDGPEPDDPFVVFTTSGTTSKPKMVLHTQRSIAEHATDAAKAFGYRSDDVALMSMPFCGTFGLSNLTSSLAAGATIVVEDHFDVRETAARIVDDGITVANGSDDMFHRLLLAGADISSLRLAGYARFNSSLEGIVERSERAGALLTGLYGMSEVQALFAIRNPSGDAPSRSFAGGTMVSGRAQFRIVDGELWLKGPSLFSGYLAEGGDSLDTTLTARAFSDGWFRTGDVAEGPATSDEQLRTFTYVTRMGDALRLGGFLVSPADVEQKILEVPGVEQALVVAVDLPTGARPVAFVVAPGGVDESAVISHCASKLAKYKVPVRVLLIEEFPTTPSANGNKIQNVKLRELARAALGLD